MFRKRKRKGQAIVEMALVFPFFILIIVGGLIDFGFAFYNFLSLQQVANDTAQWAAESQGSGTVPSDSEIIEYANSRRPQWWTGNFTVSPPQTSDLTQTGGEYVSVLMTYDSPTYTPFYQVMFEAVTGASSIRLAAQAAYKIPELVTSH
ncbi:MAG: TadE family protein [Candidatus Rifleibacteriota bacterium]